MTPGAYPAPVPGVRTWKNWIYILVLPAMWNCPPTLHWFGFRHPTEPKVLLHALHVRATRPSPFSFLIMKQSLIRELLGSPGP